MAMRNSKKNLNIIRLSFIALVAVVCIAVANIKRKSNGHNEILTVSRRIVLQVIEKACSATLYPDVCVSSILSYPQSWRAAASKDLANIAVKVTIDQVKNVSAVASHLNAHPTDPNDQAALEDCVELFEYTLLQLNDSLLNLMTLSAKSLTRQQADDVQTWLSASLTNLQTCIDLLERSDGSISSFRSSLQHVSKLVSNSLAIVNSISIAGEDDESLAPHNRRLLFDVPNGIEDGEDHFFWSYSFTEEGFPVWLSSKDRKLLQVSQGGVPADAVVAQDGTGDYRTISQALNAAPGESRGRYVIYVKAGVYQENLRVSKDHIMLIGDGKDVTVVTGSQSGISISAAVCVAMGEGFIARDMTFENTAGPDYEQAVAVRIGSDHSAFYRCSFKGYQDTLYAYSQRQFYRECDIYGTIDFIFGNAAAVFQSCNILARKPRSGQQNVITAQGRIDPNQNTGFSIHNSEVTAASDLRPEQGSVPTYLGRPWREYSRTVYMQSFLDKLIHPSGWKEWYGSFALETLYYGEYMNSGPGAGTAERVKWPGYRVITTVDEANQFTVAELISGKSWLPSTGVAFQAGLTG